MSSATLNSLRQTLGKLRRRRDRLFLLRQGSVFVAAITLMLLSGSLLALWLEAGKLGSIIIFITLIAGVLAALSLLVWSLYRHRVDDQRLAHYVEDHIPDLEQRLLTSLEFSAEHDAADEQQTEQGVSRQFIRQLWQDAEIHLRRQHAYVSRVTPARRSLVSAVLALATVLLTGTAFLVSVPLQQAGYRITQPFAIAGPVRQAEQLPDIEITVQPGDLELQRGESVTIMARIGNTIPPAVTLRIQDDNLNWRDLAMRRDGSGSDSATYSYFLPALQTDTIYYVSFSDSRAGSAGAVGAGGGYEHRSPQYRISLYDLPQVEQIDLSFDYPDYTGLTDISEEDSGDMIVPEGTEVELLVTFNKAVREATLEMENIGQDADNDTQPATPEPYGNLSLALDGNVGRASFTVNQDGVYQITATDFDGLNSNNPAQYFIRVIKDLPPELVLRRPGRDQEVMPLEEVVLEVDASDDYGLSQFVLNYSVVGAEDVAVNFLPQPNARQVSGNKLIYLEDLGVEPGDFISYFLTVADNNGLKGATEVISDIYFLQIISTDQSFQRNSSQGGQGGGGQGGADSSALVRIQKDIIAATWKLKNRQAQVSAEEFAADVEIIAEAQREATGRARMSIDRLSERLNFSDDSYDEAVENLSLAIEQMNLAARELDLEQITSALRPEQQALQYILRAEASINLTGITMEQNGGGGGGAQQEREDLRELFEMELGQLENRYEAPNTPGSPAAQNSEEASKLEELARRQEGLTRAQRNLARREEQMTEEQKRRELERLMRQQEQLSREVAQLAQQMSRNQQNRNPSAQSQQAQSQSSGQSQAQSQTALERAAQQMQEAAESESASLAAARSQKALDNLRQQQRELSQQATRSIDQIARNLGQRGQQLLEQQRQLQEALAETSREQGLGQTRQEARSDDSLQALIEDQQRQQRDLKEIRDMLRAIIARGDNEDQRLLAQAQEASRDVRPIQEEMQTSNRVLRNGMISLAVDIEEEIEQELVALARALSALDPARQDSGNEQQQNALAAAQLREQIETLQQQVQAFNEDAEAPSLAQMREQLSRSRQLAQQLTQQLEQQNTAGNQQAGGRRQLSGAAGNQRQLTGGTAGNNELNQQQGQGSTAPRTDGNNSPYGGARSIRQQITQRDIEDFLNQPELLTALLQPIIELEAALRAQAELSEITEKIYTTVDEDIPEEYRALVEEYYRVLSENQSERQSESQPRGQ
ncbi:MAG: DUF4175 family protein [Pseudohongiellaceae bacterium]